MRAPEWLTARPVAHRGFHDRGAGRIENTLTAARAAMARNFAIECDLQLTSDEVPVVFHDNTLDRLTDDTGRVARTTLAVIKTARLKDTDDRIPTFEELLKTVAGKVPLVVELKSDWTGNRRLATETAKLIDGYQGPLAVMSFDSEVVRAMSTLAPAIPRGLTADRFAAPDYPGLSSARRFALRHLLSVPLNGACFIAFHVKDLPANAPLFLRHVGVPLLTWTVRTPEDRATAARYADQIIFENFDPEAG